MPNAQTHLMAATTLLQSPTLSECCSWLQTDTVIAAFLLGNISPDVRAMNGMAREDTHFFDIPPTRDDLPQVLMLEAWAELRDASGMSHEQAAFVAGYVCHLLMDYIWLEKVVMPGLFIDGEIWGIKHPNWRLYSILMTYLEYQAVDKLPSDVIEQIERAEPDHWLPFVPDQDLIRWRDRVVELARRGGARILSQYFAMSNDMTAEELEAIVTSPTAMARDVYPTVPEVWLNDFQHEAHQRSEIFMVTYLKST